MNSLINLKLVNIIKICKRRMWVILASFLIIPLFAFIYCVTAKELYRSSTTILIIPQKVPEAYVRSTVTLDIGTRLRTLNQQILSRTRLLEVINEYHLYPNLKDKMSKEELVSYMRKQVRVKVNGRDSFKVEFSHEDPEISMLVTARLASLFINSNLELREQQAEGTLNFLDSQIESIKKKIDRKDRFIKEFRKKYLGELPEQLGANLSLLSRYQDQYVSINDSIRSAEDRLIFIGNQIAELKVKGGFITNENDTKIGNAGPEIHLLVQLEAARKNLAKMKVHYTDNHPEVARVKKEIIELEKMIDKIRTDPKYGENNKTIISTVVTNPIIQQIETLEKQKKSLILDIKKMEREREIVEKKIQEYRNRVENTPTREQELKQLTRDYSNLLKTYQDLLSKRLSAEISKNLEIRQKGEQFQILDPANRPEEPYKPVRRRIMFLSLVASLVFGIGAAIGLDYFDNTAWDEDEVESGTGFPCLVSIPLIAIGEEKRNRFVRKIMMGGAFVVYFLIWGVFIYLQHDKIFNIIKSNVKLLGLK